MNDDARAAASHSHPDPQPAKQTLTPAKQTLTIDCDICVMQRTSACTDCVVSFIVGREPGDALVIDVEAARSLRALADGGLVPALRHRPVQRTGT